MYVLLYFGFFSFYGYSYLFIRFNLALEKDDLNGKLDFNVQREILDWFHRMQNLYDGSHSWYDTSCRSLTEYWHCDGCQLLNWKESGYITVFDLLQV